MLYKIIGTVFSHRRRTHRPWPHVAQRPAPPPAAESPRCQPDCAQAQWRPCGDEHQSTRDSSGQTEGQLSQGAAFATSQRSCRRTGQSRDPRRIHPALDLS